MPAKNTTTTEQLWSSYQELGTLRAVADRHGYVSVGAVWRRLHLAGHQMFQQRATRSTRRYPIEDVQALYFRLGSYRAVAKQVGSTPDAVRMRLARAVREVR
jgi:hypothetical protein